MGDGEVVGLRAVRGSGVSLTGGIMWIKIVDESSLPVPPCIGFWNDGKCTVLDSQNDYEYAINLIDGKTITHWQPLPEPPKGE